VFTYRILLLALCFISSFAAKAQKITAAEYFFDKDPATGKGKKLSVGTSGDSVHFTASILVASLSPGFHALCIRAKISNGVWGIFESRSFYISSGTGGLPNITAAEYFFDEDPMTGKGKSLPVGTTGDSVHFVAPMPIESLQAGFHTLSMRTKTSEGKWGIFESRNFYISQSSGTLPNITASEYFFDKDPGEGKGNALSVIPGDSVHLIVSIPSTSLQPGFHTLCIRSQNADGTSGIFESRNFYISKSIAGLSKISTAEYFFDNDPGVGKGKKLSVSPSGDSVHLIASIPITSFPKIHRYRVGSL
jgi:hypothetical protein